MTTHIRNRHSEDIIRSYGEDSLKYFDFSEQDMRDADFSGMDLTGANFSEAALYDADFRGTMLTGANFYEANLDSALFDGALLRGANFCEATLTNASLRNAILNSAIFHSAYMRDADITSASMWDTVGDGTVIQTIQTGRYVINITADAIQIGCQRHTPAEWMGFADGYIASMDDGALQWWETWKPVIKAALSARGM